MGLREIEKTASQPSRVLHAVLAISPRLDGRDPSILAVEPDDRSETWKFGIEQIFGIVSPMAEARLLRVSDSQATLTGPADSATYERGFPLRGAYAPFHRLFPLRPAADRDDFPVFRFPRDAVLKAAVKGSPIDIQVVNSKGDTIYSRVLAMRPPARPVS
jgi:hypothetical protein